MLIVSTEKPRHNFSKTKSPYEYFELQERHRLRPFSACLSSMNGKLILNRCRKLPKGLKDYAAFDELKRKLDEFTELIPLLEQMANKAMQRRHWDRISELVGKELDYESDQFSMKSILECDLYKHREDIEVRSYWLKRCVFCE